MTISSSGAGETDWSPAVPFTIVRSAGGPHDDLSFCSGFRLGALHALLGCAAKLHDDGPLSMNLACHELAQADLLAMAAGWMMTHVAVLVEGERHEWHVCSFARASDDLTIPL